jgi:hypothetical protein
MDEIVSMAPVNFFQLGADIHSLPTGKGKTPFRLEPLVFSKYKLPDSSKFCHEKPFAKIAMGWSKEGVEIAVHVEVESIRCAYPNFSTGDSVELMIDTRDVKTSGYNTRFCHHFFFLPEAVDGVQAGEITRFRTEDTHELCDAKDLQIKTHSQNEGYRINIFIPAHCLFGYDPDQFNRLGFTYRINASTHHPQHFSVLSDEFQIEQQPSLWASLTLAQ